MTDYRSVLRDFKSSQEFCVGIDSDGCVFDTMELKHKECFIPNIIYYYELQAASKFARETAEFVNLYSKWRGINRFPGLKMVIDMLQERPEVTRRGVRFKNMDALGRFVKSGKPLGNPSLKEELAKTPDPDLELALEWSESVNRDIARMVRGVAPFPGVRDCLEFLSDKADQLVVSATPLAALTSEWQENDIAGYTRLIAGQEVGSKKETLEAARMAGYKKDHLLMVGDAPGDLKAARANDALFYPIVPGEEEESWARLRDEGLDRFLNQKFAGDYEKSLVDYFLSRLPSTPPWKGQKP